MLKCAETAGDGFVKLRSRRAALVGPCLYQAGGGKRSGDERDGGNPSVCVIVSQLVPLNLVESWEDFETARVN